MCAMKNEELTKVAMREEFQFDLGEGFTVKGDQAVSSFPREAGQSPPL